MTTNSSSQDNGHLESPKSSPTREVWEEAYKLANWIIEFEFMNPANRHMTMVELKELYTSKILEHFTTRKAARDELVAEIEAYLPEQMTEERLEQWLKDNPQVNADLSFESRVTTNIPRALGHNECLSAVRTLLSKKKETK